MFITLQDLVFNRKIWRIRIKYILLFFLRRLYTKVGDWLFIVARENTVLKISTDVLPSHRRRSLSQEDCLFPRTFFLEFFRRSTEVHNISHLIFAFALRRHQLFVLNSVRSSVFVTFSYISKASIYYCILFLLINFIIILVPFNEILKIKFI